MNIGIVGLGLIGGSLGRALVKKTEHKIYASDTDAETMVKGKLLGAYHEVLDKTNAKELDLLLIALYPNAVIECMEEYTPLLKSGSVVVDCAGTKREIVGAMRKLKERFPQVNFVGAHPMAGKEFSGIKHSSAGLFEGASVLIVPVLTSIAVLAKVKEFFLQTGAEHVIVTNAEAHDKMISYTSQLAHIVSSAYVNNESALSHYGFTAGSFRDMTRVAKLNPQMWTELMIENSDNLTGDLDLLIQNLKDFRSAVATKNTNALNELLGKGNRIKVDIESDKGKKLEIRTKQGEGHDENC